MVFVKLCCDVHFEPDEEKKIDLSILVMCVLLSLAVVSCAVNRHVGKKFNVIPGQNKSKTLRKSVFCSFRDDVDYIR